MIFFFLSGRAPGEGRIFCLRLGRRAPGYASLPCFSSAALRFRTALARALRMPHAVKFK
ncbi:hypothetical protein [Thermaurantimonas sp.]|uniref:hypothetical protein n=1 Tax=Thermaurantimonas sp. TaxID=2681568 RepID=UPI00391B0907